jgi:biotin synthase
VTPASTTCWWANLSCVTQAPAPTFPDVLAQAREQVLERGEGLSREQVLDVLRLPDGRLEELLALAHDVRMRWCGPEVEVEGIISLKTGGCPEDCHFCAQSGLFASPVRSAWLDIPSLVEAAKQTAKTGATEFCIVAAVRGPDERLMAQVACSTSSRSTGWPRWACTATTTIWRRRGRFSPTW